LTAFLMRCLQPKYLSVVWTETWPSRNCCPASTTKFHRVASAKNVTELINVAFVNAEYLPTGIPADSLNYVWPSQRVEQCGDATRALTKGPDHEGRFVRPFKSVCWDGRFALNPGGLGASPQLQSDQLHVDLLWSPSRCYRLYVGARIASEDKLSSNGCPPFLDPALQVRS
jgi:hypothetical protein